MVYLVLLLLVFLAAAQDVLAYIPALPTNSSKDAIAGGLNISDVSDLYMEWFSNGSYSQSVSYQLAGNGSSGISRGALVHFSEEKVSNMTPGTNTPWIAMVACDANATDASMEDDIFTLARDKGAVAALLYSAYSLACVINPEYADPATFDQVFDIFSTQSLISANLIEYQFGQLGAANKSLWGFDSKKLNDSESAVNQSIALGYPTASGFLYAVLRAYNATVELNNTSTPGDSGNSTATSQNNSPNTNLAMIILYAITGCVSALFCIVIVSGAIRAIRHPERYGPRARTMGEGGGPGQSRARGLTRAILDTFPVVKFGGSSPSSATASDAAQEAVVKDPEGQIISTGVEMRPLVPVDSNLRSYSEVASQDIAEKSRTNDSTSPHFHARLEIPISNDNTTVNQYSEETSVSRSHPSSPILSSIRGDLEQLQDRGEGSSRVPAAGNTALMDVDEVQLSSIGRDTCPICIIDFEEGDDLRVLPCEGKHCFHQHCVDPWLLELSSSCPICRHDFLALEHMLSGQSDDVTRNVRRSTNVGSLSQTAHGNRFSRYLRFATTRRRNRRDEEPDPTDPYMPTAPETSVYSG